METSMLRPKYVWSTINKNIIRSVTVSVTADKVTTYKNDTLKSWREIPGPNSLPVIGAMHHFLPGGIFHDYNGLELANKLYNTYGPIVRLDNIIGRDPQIFIYDAESASKILRTENWAPTRPGMQTLEHYRKNTKTDLQKEKPTGLLTEHGDEWKELRSIVNPMMLNPNAAKLYTSSIDKVANDMIARLKSQRDKNNRLKTEFDDEMSLWSVESIGVVALGYRLGCFDPNLPEDIPAKKLIACVHEELKLIRKLDFSPTLWKYFPTRHYKRAMEVYELQENISKDIINKAIEMFHNKKSSGEEKSVFEKLFEIDEEMATKIATEMLFAGVASVSNAMASLLYFLSVNPDKQKKLREELKSNDEKKRYLKACIKESMRLMPVVSYMRRLTSKEYNVLGYNIPANTDIFIGNHLMSSMEEHYPRPKEYLPERWLVKEDDPLHYRQAHPFAFAPFGLGVRNCIARRIAELMMEIFTSRMVESFQVEWSGPPPTFKEIFLNYTKGPFNFIFNDAPK